MQQETTQTMSSTVFQGSSSTRSNWATLPNNLKQKIINYLPETSFHQVVELCKDADCTDIDYRYLFKKAGFELPTNASNLTNEDWKNAYAQNCTELQDALARISDPTYDFDITDKWICNKMVVLAALEENEEIIDLLEDAEGLPNYLINDRDLVFAAVNRNGRALRVASKELQNDPTIVLAAVMNDGYALTYASKELQNDKEVVLAAVMQYGGAFQYASKELQNDKIILIAFNLAFLNLQSPANLRSISRILASKSKLVEDILAFM